ncbi:hypothetical protein RclHR1_06140003 [Rhizophagus clarus]|uniref:Uncharacterized protein n=1 Tax=Rhizophagus clarus TaxID=94130 RepID=A0A2Z6RSM7_9GLOM|nr:hypothetical protein RclHR1_06140003 [Rhizophagus clarus]GES95818.1 hypothetical protein RCL_e22497_RclHR1_06140003 [Rhizophagus clarus]
MIRTIAYNQGNVNGKQTRSFIENETDENRYSTVTTATTAAIVTEDDGINNYHNCKHQKKLLSQPRRC